LVKNCNNWHIVEEALAQNKGIIFITPHLGNYDIAGRYLSQRLIKRPQAIQLMAMYRPPKMAWLEPLMNAGRVREGGLTAPATAAGVRMVMKTLKARQTTIILPDQVPGQGDGVWAPFFGRPAYTMTLAPRLAQMDGVEVILFFGRRLGWGRGFEVEIARLPEPFTGDKTTDGAKLNQAVEQLIRQAPAQYLWSYNRYKTPAGVAPAETPNP
jgi:KDO2-lipid IV(A) lauroyltransferase